MNTSTWEGATMAQVQKASRLQRSEAQTGSHRDENPKAHMAETTHKEDLLPYSYRLKHINSPVE